MDSDAEDHPASHYDDGNRAFLQAFLARGSLKFEDAQRILAAIFAVQENREIHAEDVTQADFDSYVSAAADAISPFDYEIRSTQDQVTKSRLYALVNSSSDSLTQLATMRTADEILYVKRLLDGMFEIHNTKRREVMAITSMTALESKYTRGTGTRRSIGEEGTQTVDKGVTHSEAEKVLASMVKENWFDLSKHGFYRLSARGLMELRTWLVETYNDSDDPSDWQRIKFCEACKEIVTVGQRCDDLECNMRLHNICDGAYWNSRPAKDCPKCSIQWTGKRFVGEKAITSTEEYLKGKRRSGGVAESAQSTDDEEPAPRRQGGTDRAPSESVGENGSDDDAE